MLSLVPRPFVKYKRTRQRMRVCRLVNNYASPRAQEFLLMVISKWLRPHRVHEYRLENLISPKRNTVRGVIVLYGRGMDGSCKAYGESLLHSKNKSNTRGYDLPKRLGGRQTRRSQLQRNVKRQQTHRFCSCIDGPLKKLHR